MKTVNSVRALVIRTHPVTGAEEVLMIEQAAKKFHLAQNPDAPKTYWDLPGGKVDPGQTRSDAACRETFEETGITVVDPYVAFDITKTVLQEDFRRNIAVVVCLAVDDAELTTAHDPDAQILGAEWKPKDEAMLLLQQMQDRDLSEPLVDFLAHDKARCSHWEYEMKPGEKTLSRQSPRLL